jgi:hypothetical protein
MIQRAYQIAAGLRYIPRRPGVDEKYRRFIRRFPCIGCGSTRWIEFMHTGPRGLGQKADDADGLPGCGACHRTGPRALHRIGPVKFQESRRVDFAELRQMFRTLYLQGYR